MCNYSSLNLEEKGTAPGIGRIMSIYFQGEKKKPLYYKLPSVFETDVDIFSFIILTSCSKIVKSSVKRMQIALR